jgi:hypothetical protein
VQLEMASNSSADGRPARPEFAISGWEAGNDDIWISVYFNGVRFELFLSRNKGYINSPNSLSDFNKYFTIISSTGKSTRGKEDTDGERYLRSIAASLFPNLKHLAPLVKHGEKLPLDHLFICKVYECEVIFINEKPHSVDLRPRTYHHEDHEDHEVDTDANQWPFPTFLNSDVEVSHDDPYHTFDIMPNKIFVGDQSLFYKPSSSEQDSIPEIEKFATIEKSGLSVKELRTSRLCGVVVTEKRQFRGLLYHWIDVKADGWTLNWAVNEKTPISLRQKWADQIKDTVSKLHELGVIWGNVNAGNVLVDSHDDVVLIGFAGGTTRCWVDKDLGGTVEGDLQGLERMMDFLLNDGSTLRRVRRAK